MALGNWLGNDDLNSYNIPKVFNTHKTFRGRNTYMRNVEKISKNTILVDKSVLSVNPKYRRIYDKA